MAEQLTVGEVRRVLAGLSARAVVQVCIGQEEDGRMILRPATIQVEDIGTSQVEEWSVAIGWDESDAKARDGQ